MVGRLRSRIGGVGAGAVARTVARCVLQANVMTHAWTDRLLGTDAPGPQPHLIGHEFGARIVELSAGVDVIANVLESAGGVDDFGAENLALGFAGAKEGTE